jgi:MFS transporter, SHS family, lactate transporter
VAFFEQFCVQGAWGVIPIYVMELSPGSFRTFIVGTSYQLGNLVSSASSTIEAKIGERFPLPSEDKNLRYRYGFVICIFMGCVYLYVVVLTFLGPEYLMRQFGVAYDDDITEVAGHDTAAAVIQRHKEMGTRTSESDREDNGIIGNDTTRHAAQVV